MSCFQYTELDLLTVRDVDSVLVLEDPVLGPRPDLLVRSGFASGNQIRFVLFPDCSECRGSEFISQRDCFYLADDAVNEISISPLFWIRFHPVDILVHRSQILFFCSPVELRIPDVVEP